MNPFEEVLLEPQSVKTLQELISADIEKYYHMTEEANQMMKDGKTVPPQEVLLEPEQRILVFMSFIFFSGYLLGSSATQRFSHADCMNDPHPTS